MLLRLILNHLIIPRLIIMPLREAHFVKMAIDVVEGEDVVAIEEEVPVIATTEFTEKVAKRVLHILRNKFIYAFENESFFVRHSCTIVDDPWPCFS